MHPIIDYRPRAGHCWPVTMAMARSAWCCAAGGTEAADRGGSFLMDGNYFAIDWNYFLMDGNYFLMYEDYFLMYEDYFLMYENYF